MYMASLGYKMPFKEEILQLKYFLFTKCPLVKSSYFENNFCIISVLAIQALHSETW